MGDRQGNFAALNATIPTQAWKFYVEGDVILTFALPSTSATRQSAFRSRFSVNTVGVQMVSSSSSPTNQEVPMLRERTPYFPSDARFSFTRVGGPPGLTPPSFFSKSAVAGLTLIMFGKT